MQIPLVSPLQKVNLRDYRRKYVKMGRAPPKKKPKIFQKQKTKSGFQVPVNGMCPELSVSRSKAYWIPAEWVKFSLIKR